MSSNSPIRELILNPAAKQILLQISPEAEQMPGSMLDMSLRQITEKYGNPRMEIMLGQLDAALAGID